MKKNKVDFFERAKEIYDLRELEKLGLSPDLDQRDLILNYLTLIFKWNNTINIMSKNDEDIMFLRHFCDSLQLLLLFGFKKNASVLDIGAGAGFPSIPTRVFRPDLSFTLAESNKKKASFLNEVKSKLGLENVVVKPERTDDINDGERYDYVISRGVTSIKDFALMSLPFLNEGGRIYTYQTKNFIEDLQNITENKEELGVCVSEIAEYDLGKLISNLNLVAIERLQ